MDYFLVMFLVLVLSAVLYAKGGDDPFEKTYCQTWGGNHLTISNQGKQVQLLMDASSGAGFSSKQEFGSGYFGTNIKIPNKNSKGIVTSFYLMEVPPGKPVEGVKHNEFDIEFFGTDGNPHMINTNVFSKDLGDKEQQFHLWFDPTVDFHKYEILWNQYQIVWFVDGTPIRVWKNNTQLGVNYPAVPMHVEASIWNPSWLEKPDWSQGPFMANYRGFGIDGCPHQASNPYHCSSQIYYWNAKKYWKLDADQQSKLHNTRKQFMFYDYCNDPKKHGPECQVNQ